MTEELDFSEITYRKRALLCNHKEHGSRKLLVKVIYEELYHFFYSEIQLKGDYLREPPLKENNQLYEFPAPKGITLEAMIRQKVKLSIQDISLIFDQLLLATFKLHQQKILGRCFNIENIYFFSNQIQLSAFGFYPDLQMIPPESIQQKTYGIEIDIWLIGVVMYQLLTGNILQNFNSLEEYSHFYQKIERKSIDKQFSVILIKILHPQVQKRLTFGQLHSIYKCIPQNEQIREFYREKIDLYSIANQIRLRENFNSEWAVPKEFNEKATIQVFPTQHIKKLEKSAYITPDPDFMQFYCRSQEEKSAYPEAWREMHFQFYRFHIMDSQIQCLKLLSKVPFVIWTRYCLQSMLIIIKREFLRNIEEMKNFLGLTCKQWNSFLKNSNELRLNFVKLEKSLLHDQKQLDELSKESQDKSIEYHHEEKQLLAQLVKDGIFHSNACISKFEVYKVPYRRCLQYGYYELEKIIRNEKNSEDIKFFVRLRLKTIICMAINRIFDKPQCEIDGLYRKQNRDINFSVLQNTLSTEKLISPSQIQDFLLRASVSQLQSQTEEIHKLFFTRNSITTPTFNS